MPKNMNAITNIITLEGIEKINTEKMTTKHSKEYSHFLLAHFSGLKYILARQILHFSIVSNDDFSPQNAPQCPTK